MKDMMKRDHFREVTTLEAALAPLQAVPAPAPELGQARVVGSAWMDRCVRPRDRNGGDDPKT